MAVFPRLELSIVRGSPAQPGIGVLMSAMTVEVPPYLLVPALAVSWLSLAPFLALHWAALAFAHSASGPVRGLERSHPPDRAVVARRGSRRPVQPGPARRGAGPDEAPDRGVSNVISFPTRGRRE